MITERLKATPLINPLRSIVMARHLPNAKDGIAYWDTQPATLDGVLGVLIYLFFHHSVLTIELAIGGFGTCVSAIQFRQL